MIKKKAQKKTAAKKSAKKRVAKSKKELNPAEVRRDIAKMVGTEATGMAKAAIDEGKKGQLAPLKYLLELAKIYPEGTDENQGTPEADCLAKTLLNRLNIPDVPIVHDENGELVKAPAKTDVEGQAGDGKDAGASPAGDSCKDRVLTSAEVKSS